MGNVNNKLCVRVTAIIDHTPSVFVVKGKPARTFCALAEAGSRGITALEMSNTWALRISEYIRVLRHDYNLEIETIREEHDGGWHGRYVLDTPIEMIEEVLL